MNRLGFWWSLGLEVQFYLLLPILVYLLSKYFWKGIVIISLLLIIPSIWWFDNSWLFRINSLFLGLIAWKIADSIKDNKITNNFQNNGLLLLVILFCELFLFKSLDSYQAFMNFHIGMIFSVIIIVFSLIKKDLFGFIGKWLVFLGKISFSLYLCHGLIFAVVEFFLSSYLENNLFYYSLMLSIYPLSILISLLSYKYIEPIGQALKKE